MLKKLCVKLLLSKEEIETLSQLEDFRAKVYALPSIGSTMERRIVTQLVDRYQKSFQLIEHLIK